MREGTRSPLLWGFVLDLMPSRTRERPLGCVPGVYPSPGSRRSAHRVGGFGGETVGISGRCGTIALSARAGSCGPPRPRGTLAHGCTSPSSSAWRFPNLRGCLENRFGLLGPAGVQIPPPPLVPLRMRELGGRDRSTVIRSRPPQDRQKSERTATRTATRRHQLISAVPGMLFFRYDANTCSTSARMVSTRPR